MLIRSRIEKGEGVLEYFNLEIGRAHRREKMEDEDYWGEYENSFRNAFYQIVDIVEKLFADYQEILEKKKTKKEQAEDNDLGKGGEPSEPSSPSSSCSSKISSIASSNPKKQPKKAKYDLHYLKINIKFYFPTYNGELNTEN